MGKVQPVLLQPQQQGWSDRPESYLEVWKKQARSKDLLGTHPKEESKLVATAG